MPVKIPGDMMLPARIIDSHVHFWWPGELHYAWMNGIAELNGNRLPEHLAEASAGLPLEQIVFIQAACRPGEGLREVDRVVQLAAWDSRIAAIVADAPLELGERAAPHLDLLKVIPRVRGVRRLIQWEAPGFSIQPAFVAGVRLLAAYGFSFDICIFHQQLKDVLQLVAQCPGVSFVLDHLGKPGIRDGLREPWGAQLKELASFPNVHCKLSGMVTEADHHGWRYEDLVPYLEQTIDAFGAQRVMYGSDWPVSTLACSYRRWVEVLARATAAMAPEDRDRIFYRNAKAYYRL